MTYLKKVKSGHSHRWFVDAPTGEIFCVCGAQKDSMSDRAKYHNHSQVYKGQSFRSGLEVRFMVELEMRQRAGEVIDWEREVKLDLKVNGLHICNYYIDFIVKCADGHYEWTEVKGLELPLWQMKFKILEATFEDFKRTPDDVMIVYKEKSSWKRK